MKFFSKNNQSEILLKGLKYTKNKATNNALIRDLLVKEQFHFCAYSEKYIDELDSVEVEHFESSKKYNDDYYNYYAVLRKPNLFKKDESYINAVFFKTLFFQNQEILKSKIKYVKNEFVFEVVDSNDKEAQDFIDFLGLNNHDLYSIRKKHVKRLEFIFLNFNFSKNDILNYFKNHLSELSFITIIEIEFELDLSVFYS